LFLMQEMGLIPEKKCIRLIKMPIMSFFSFLVNPGFVGIFNDNYLCCLGTAPKFPGGTYALVIIC